MADTDQISPKDEGEVDYFGKDPYWVGEERETGNIHMYIIYIPSTLTEWSPCSLLIYFTEHLFSPRLDLIMAHPYWLLQYPLSLYRVPLTLLVAYSGNLKIILKFFFSSSFTFIQILFSQIQNTLILGSLLFTPFPVLSLCSSLPCDQFSLLQQK